MGRRILFRLFLAGDVFLSPAEKGMKLGGKRKMNWFFEHCCVARVSIDEKN